MAAYFYARKGGVGTNMAGEDTDVALNVAERRHSHKVLCIHVFFYYFMFWPLC